jgi:hypothetical protein
MILGFMLGLPMIFRSHRKGNKFFKHVWDGAKGSKIIPESTPN